MRILLVWAKASRYVKVHGVLGHHWRIYHCRTHHCYACSFAFEYEGGDGIGDRMNLVWEARTRWWGAFHVVLKTVRSLRSAWYDLIALSLDWSNAPGLPALTPICALSSIWQIFFFFLEVGDRVWLCHLGRSAVVQSWLNATSTSWAQATYPPQLPE